MVEALRGEAGYLALTQVTIESLDREDHLLFAAVTDSGQPIDAETCEKLIGVQGHALGAAIVPSNTLERLRASLAAMEQGAGR